MDRKPQRPQMTREQYERMMQRKRAEQKRKREIRKRKAVFATFIILFIAVIAVMAVMIVKHNSKYKDPSDVIPSSSQATTDTQATMSSQTDGTTDTQPTATSNGKISFIAAGDNLIHEGIYRDAAKRAKNGEDFNFKDMYDGVADIISSADIAYVNQETPMAGESYGYNGYPSFNTPQKDGDTLVDLGFNVVNIATNHMLDMGTSGLADSIKYWKTKDVTLLGAFTKSDYDSIRTTESNGITIAWLSYTYGINEGHSLDSASDICIPYIDDSDIIRQAELAKKAGDIVIASVHWGTDSSMNITQNQRAVAQTLCDNGVDVIIGTHSHTLQSIETLTSADGKHETLCYYSLGNLISTMLYYNLMVGGIATFDIVKDADGAHVENPAVIPTMCYYEKNDYGTTTSYPYNLAVYTLDKFPESLAATHGAQIDGSFTYNDLISLVKGAVDKKYLSDFYK